MQSLVAGIHEFLERANQLAAWQSLAEIRGPDFQAFHCSIMIDAYFLGWDTPKANFSPKNWLLWDPSSSPWT
jgi:hypothetical protein